MGETYRQQPVHKYHPPPPLIPVRQLNGGLRYENAQNHYPNTPADVVDLSANNHQMINQQPAHQQPARSLASSTQDDRTNGRINNVQRKMTQIADTPTSGSHIPYKMQKAIIEGKMVPSINMKPYIHTELLVTITDLVNIFFNNVSVQACQQVMQVLGIEIYKGNPSQIHVLIENGKCQSPSEACPLVQVCNVIEFMPQLKYMLGGMEIASKRS